MGILEDGSWEGENDAENDGTVVELSKVVGVVDGSSWRIDGEGVDILGNTVGEEVGVIGVIVEGFGDGSADGILVGISVGNAVGKADGKIVGICVGDVVGSIVGAPSEAIAYTKVQNENNRYFM